MAGRTYTILELQGIVSIQARTLRHWIRRKLLPKPLGRGRSARYIEAHLLRAQAVLHFRSQRAGLEVIR